MAEIRLTKVEQGQTKIRNVPIAVTPEGFWCCPSPVMFQKTLKAQSALNKPKTSSPSAKTTDQKKQTVTASDEKKPASNTIRSFIASDDHQKLGSDAPAVTTHVIPERPSRQKVENMPKKVAVEFGEPGTSDLKVFLLGKQGFCVKLSVHKDVLMGNSSFFTNKLAERELCFSCLEIDDCEDVEIYVETVGLMYCKDMKQRLIKQSVPRVLRILKVAESLGFNACIQTCLDYLEAVPWVGQEEEEKVVSSVLRLQNEGVGVTPVLKRVASNVSDPPKETLSHIIDLVLRSHEEKGRREMKSIVLKLLKEHDGENCNETIYAACRSCMDSLSSIYKQATQPEFVDMPEKDCVLKQIGFEADNLSWLLEILAQRRAADEFAQTWAQQQELSELHSKLPVMSRCHVSRVSARIFIGIGKGELLPPKDTRLLLLQTWLQPLISDYGWLHHGCRSFDRKVAEEGIGRTILTLPLEDQQSILLSWLGSFLKAGDNCPNLLRAFEVWWRRAFVRPYADARSNNSTFQSEKPITSASKTESSQET